MVKEGKIKDVFSMCMRPNGDGGHLYLGTDGPSSDSIAGNQLLETEWTPMLRKSGFYGVNMTDLKVAGESIGLPPQVYNEGDAIVDSGSALVTLPKTAYNHIKKAFLKLCDEGVCMKGVCHCKEKRPLKTPIFSGSSSRCVTMTPADIEAFPMVEFVFGGNVTVQYSPANYLKNGALFCEGQTLNKYTIAF